MGGEPEQQPLVPGVVLARVAVSVMTIPSLGTSDAMVPSAPAASSHQGSQSLF